MKEQAKPTLLVDDERVRVTRFDFAPGAETGWHRHEHDYVVTAITVCEMELVGADGQVKTATLAPGDSYRRNEGIEHNVTNAGQAPMTFVEVEMK